MFSVCRVAELKACNLQKHQLNIWDQHKTFYKQLNFHCSRVNTEKKKKSSSCIFPKLNKRVAYDTFWTFSIQKLIHISDIRLYCSKFLAVNGNSTMKPWARMYPCAFYICKRTSHKKQSPTLHFTSNVYSWDLKKRSFEVHKWQRLKFTFHNCQSMKLYATIDLFWTNTYNDVRVTRASMTSALALQFLLLFVVHLWRGWLKDPRCQDIHPE